METRPSAFRMSLTLLAVVVLSASCAAEAIVAATPRWDIAASDSAMAYWSAGRDRDATPARTVRASDSRSHEDSTLAADDWTGWSHAAALALRADGTWPCICERVMSQVSALSPTDQLSPHHLNLPPPKA